MQKMTEEERIQAARNDYMRSYRRKNRKKMAEYQRQWRESNPEAVKKHRRDYWLRKADELQVK